VTGGNGNFKLGARSDGPCRFLAGGRSRFGCGRLWFWVRIRHPFGFIEVETPGVTGGQVGLRCAAVRREWRTVNSAPGLAGSC
jgi:hypothetical protein